MRKGKVLAAVGGIVAGVAVLLAVAGRDAGAQQRGLVPQPKVLQVAGNTAGAITGVTVKVRAGGPYQLTVQGIAGYCTMSFPTAAEAAAMAARVQDAQTTGVTCQGPVNVIHGNIVPVSQIDAATDIAIVGGP